MGRKIVLWAGGAILAACCLVAVVRGRREVARRVRRPHGLATRGPRARLGLGRRRRASHRHLGRSVQDGNRGQRREMVRQVRSAQGRRGVGTQGAGQDQLGPVHRRAGRRGVALLGPVEHGDERRRRDQQGCRDRFGRLSENPPVHRRPQAGRGAEGQLRRRPGGFAARRPWAASRPQATSSAASCTSSSTCRSG